MATSVRATIVVEALPDIREWQEDLYRDLHRNPELSNQETPNCGHHRPATARLRL